MEYDLITKIPSIIAIIAIAVLFISSILRSIIGRKDISKSLGAVEKSTNKLIALNDYLKKVNAKIEHFENKINEAKSTNLKKIALLSLKEKVDKIDKEFEMIKKILFDNLEDRLSLPLLKKDVDNLGKDIESIRLQFGLILNHNKWFIGILITLAISVLGLAISILIK